MKTEDFKKNNWRGKETVVPILLQAGDKRLLINGQPPLVACRVVAEEKYQAIILELDSLHDQIAKQEVAFRETVKLHFEEKRKNRNNYENKIQLLKNRLKELGDISPF